MSTPAAPTAPRIKRATKLVGLLTLLWAVLGTWHFDCKIKRVCGPEPQAPSAVTMAPAPVAARVTTRSEASTPTSHAAVPIVPLIKAPEPLVVPPNTALLTAYFGRKSTDIIIPEASEAGLLDLHAAVAQGRRLRVIGHSDARGKPELKAELSIQRAQILRDWLLAHGIPAEAITSVESREDREPVADNGNPAGRALNRRAVVMLVP